MVEAQPALSAEDPEPGGEDEVQVGGVAQFSAADADGARRCLAAVAGPAAAVKLHSVAARSVGPHVLALAQGELVPVVGGDHEVLDPGVGELAHRAGDVPDHTVHQLAGQQVGTQLAQSVDLLGTNHDQRSRPDGLGQLGHRELE